MAELLASLSLSGQSDTTADASPTINVSGGSSFTVAGFLVVQEPLYGLNYVQHYLGDESVPNDIRRLRRSSFEMMRRFGQPVIIKHMFTSDDAEAGIAQPSPNFDPAYGQVRNRDPFSYGTGFCSIELSPNEWIDDNGNIVTVHTNPAWPAAPKYRGFGPGYLTYMIQPDAAEDFFKLSPQGALMEVQTATAVAPWFPVINDNDLVINVILDDDGRVISTGRRFQAKMTNPVTMRGRDRLGRESNRYLVNQQFPMTLAPDNSTLMSVETDR